MRKDKIQLEKPPKGLIEILNFSGRYFTTRYRRIELLAEAFCACALLG